MQEIAEAMNCKFVYAIVPEKNIESIIEEQARVKAEHIVKESGKQMALEAQGLSKNK